MDFRGCHVTDHVTARLAQGVDYGTWEMAVGPWADIEHHEPEQASIDYLPLRLPQNNVIPWILWLLDFQQL